MPMLPDRPGWMATQPCVPAWNQTRRHPQRFQRVVKELADILAHFGGSGMWVRRIRSNLRGRTRPSS